VSTDQLHASRARLAIFALALGTFAVGTTEFVIIGLLPEVADSFDVSVPTAGLLVTGYALGVTIGAPFMTLLGSRVARKHLLLGLMAIFIAGNLICAIAPSYATLMIGRVVASLTHGAFFGVGAVVAAELSPPHRRASAIALMFSGLTVANVLGVPGGTALGDALSWRATFWAVAALGAIALVGLALLIPPLERLAKPDVRSELATLRAPRVLLALATTALVCAAVFTSFTFVKPMLTDVTGFSTGAVSLLLVLFGVGVLTGNLVGARLADRNLVATLYGGIGAFAVILLLFALAVHAKVPAAIALFAFGFAGFAVFSPLQLRVLDEAQGAPTLASAMNIGAANLGNATGAWVGGLAISAGTGYAALNVVGAVLAVGALAAAFGALNLRSPRNQAPVPLVAPE
jgi:DHA1 family inner membrane transport protein